jgi:uncharacterized protein
MNGIEFDWDDANISHIAEHDVTPEEAEEVLTGDSLEMSFEIGEDGEERWSYLGETTRSRLLYLVITLRGEKIRVITAFGPPKQDKQFYLRTKAGLQDGFEDS